MIDIEIGSIQLEELNDFLTEQLEANMDYINIDQILSKEMQEFEQMMMAHGSSIELWNPG